MDIFARQFVKEAASRADAQHFAECNSYIERLRPVLLRRLDMLEAMHSSAPALIPIEGETAVKFLRKQRAVIEKQGHVVVASLATGPTTLDVLAAHWRSDDLTAIRERVFGARRGLACTVAMLRCRVRVASLCAEFRALCSLHAQLVAVIGQHPAQKTAEHQAELQSALQRLQPRWLQLAAVCHDLLEHGVYNYELVVHRQALCQLAELYLEIVAELDGHLSEAERQALGPRPSLPELNVMSYPAAPQVSAERPALAQPLCEAELERYAEREAALVCEATSRPSAVATAKELARRAMGKFKRQADKWVLEMLRVHSAIAAVLPELVHGQQQVRPCLDERLRHIAEAQRHAVEQYEGLRLSYPSVTTQRQGRLLCYQCEALTWRVKQLRDELTELFCNVVVCIPANQYPFLRRKQHESGPV